MPLSAILNRAKELLKFSAAPSPALPHFRRGKCLRRTRLTANDNEFQPTPRRSSVAGLIAGLLMLLPALAVAQSRPTPDQERLELKQALQARLPGTQPTDWALGADTLVPAVGGNVQAIPFNAENATNSADVLAIGKKLWDRKFKDGKSLTNCFPNGGKRVAATYPQYDAKAKLAITLEMAVNRCLQLHREPEIEMHNTLVMGPLSAYARSLSEGQRLALRVGVPAARDKLDSGKALFTRRIGQQNFACASCHVLQAGSVFGSGEQVGKRAVFTVLSPAIGQATTWPRLEPGGTVRTLQMQFQQCMKRSGAEPFELGSEELNNLEYYHTFLSNGLPIRVLAVQR